VWKAISEDLNFKLPSNSLYIMFYEDRHGWKSRLNKMLGFEDNKKNPLRVDHSSSSDSECSLASKKNELKKLFKITIPFDVYS